MTVTQRRLRRTAALALAFSAVARAGFAAGPYTQNTTGTTSDGQLEALSDIVDALSGGVTASTAAKATASAPSYMEGTTQPLSMDLGGNLRIGGTINASTSAHANAAAPSITEGADSSLSQTLTGDLRTISKQNGTWNITNVSGTVSLPTGAATAANQPALGTAGSASSDVITVQGITSMTALKVI